MKKSRKFFGANLLCWGIQLYFHQLEGAGGREWDIIVVVWVQQGLGNQCYMQGCVFTFIGACLGLQCVQFFICRHNGVVTGTAQCRQNIVNSFSGSLGHDACLGVRESDICRNLIWSRKGSYSIHLQELIVLFGAVMVCRTLIWQGDGEGTKSMQLRPGLVRRIIKEAEAVFFALRCGAVQDQYCKFLSRYL